MGLLGAGCRLDPRERRSPTFVLSSGGEQAFCKAEAFLHVGQLCSCVFLRLGQLFDIVTQRIDDRSRAERETDDPVLAIAGEREEYPPPVPNTSPSRLRNVLGPAGFP